MLKRIEMAKLSPSSCDFASKNETNRVQNNFTIPAPFESNVCADRLAEAYIGYNKIDMASTVPFARNNGLYYAINQADKKIVTCKDIEKGRAGEEVGSRVDVNQVLSKVKDNLAQNDAPEVLIEISNEKDSNKNIIKVTDAKTSVKKQKDGTYQFKMDVRPAKHPLEEDNNKIPSSQILSFELLPASYKTGADGQDYLEGTAQGAYVLNTKGKLTAVVEDFDNVLLTNNGSIEKKSGPALRVEVKKGENDSYPPFEITNIPVVSNKKGGSKGGGTELVIGLEQGRFVEEIIDSISTFEKKVKEGEIVLDEFVPAQNAKNIQIAMLAGGFGSRAEYTNASSSKIFHGVENGSNLTKGCFRTATGLTPMETTFVSLHKAGLLDCSKENLKIGENIKFYLNDSNVNGGNGGFSMDMYNTMKREGEEALLILPNDAMSRIPNALSEVSSLINSKKAAVVMVAKEVDKEDARGSLGIMKIDDEGKIIAFAEKPKVFEEGYVDSNGKCFANTFQFAVSKEALCALEILDKYLPSNNSGKEPRDWSKTFTPILMSLTQNDDIKEAKKGVEKITKNEVPLNVIKEAKEILKDQKIYAVKTSEPWADCGTLDALYDTVMQIAKGDFALEDFERKHVIDSVNEKTGLIASTPEQKSEIESRYNIKGHVMAVPSAEPVIEDVAAKYKNAITRYSDVN